MNQNATLVSVIMPAYNVRRFIGEAIQSVLAQNYPAIEIIVVDDGSSDDGADYVETHFPEVRLFRKENGGAATARNIGLREARGSYIAFLDADDVWLPGKIAAQMSYFEAHPEVSMLCTGFSHWLSDAEGLFSDPLKAIEGAGSVDSGVIDAELSGWIYHKLLLGNFVWTTTVMMRKGLVDKIGLFDETLRLGQDYDYFLRASRETEIHFLARVFALYRQHPGSAIARGADFNYAAHVIKRAVSRWGLASPNGDALDAAALRDRLHKIHFSCGYGHYKRGNAAAAHGEFRMSLKQRPTHLKSWVFAGLSALGKAKDRV
ncbi:MAG: family 2 glycosyl transferase [Betaproteobacteria bacterium HGW-Betaproteobacteria-21]|nr:MAG: family 2 glycosyl transferase [Betaproteobacteria bacterium HGW-Betaproteobacteria-21]